MASSEDINSAAGAPAEALPKPKPSLKINLKRGTSFANPATTPTASTPRVTFPQAASPPPMTPSGDGQHKKILLVRRASSALTPSSTVPPAFPVALATPTTDRIVSAAASEGISPLTKTKAGRTLKPTPKKRARQDDDGGGRIMGAASGAKPTQKRVKLTVTPSTAKAPSLHHRPSLVVKKHGRKPVRPPGQGYDSEAEDREEDPVIEEQFVLRMMPGEHAEYVQKAIKEKRIGISRQQGGADIALKWLDDQSRRACLTVEGQPYAAVMVDLPTVTEVMKTWNKKALVKAADICQMLLVFAKVSSEAEAKEVPLPRMVGKGYTWPHGLTPPMHDCVHRRFRKRLSKLEIQNKEEEVTRLLKADKDAVSSRWELVDDQPQDLTAAESDEEEYDEEDEDAEGEADVDADGEGDMDDVGYFPPVDSYEHEMPDEEAMRDLEREMEAEFDLFQEEADSGTPADAGEGNTPTSARSGTPIAASGSGDHEGTPEAGAAAGEEDDGDDDEDEDDELDEDEQARMDEIKGVREDAAELKRQLAKLQAELNKTANALLRKRIEGNIKKVKSELQLKLGSIGEDYEE